jgi:hypothetical protein
MHSYTITLYLAGGATAKVTSKASADDAALRSLEKELAQRECRLESQEERAILVVKNPEVNVIAYSIDRIGP